MPPASTFQQQNPEIKMMELHPSLYRHKFPKYFGERKFLPLIITNPLQTTFSTDFFAQEKLKFENDFQSLFRELFSLFRETLFSQFFELTFRSKKGKNSMPDSAGDLLEN